MSLNRGTLSFLWQVPHESSPFLQQEAFISTRRITIAQARGAKASRGWGGTTGSWGERPWNHPRATVWCSGATPPIGTSRGRGWPVVAGWGYCAKKPWSRFILRSIGNSRPGDYLHHAQSGIHRSCTGTYKKRAGSEVFSTFFALLQCLMQITMSNCAVYFHPDLVIQVLLLNNFLITHCVFIMVASKQTCSKINFKIK